jgi:hypothetical protein
MKFKVGDKVTLINADDFYLKGLKQEVGTIVQIAEKSFAPYRVKFNTIKAPKRWCKEDELESK